ncbi:MAG: hypothetical protein ABSD56_00130 [Bryobacteraceae bacterium]|jgi:hypothetical protein
MLLAPRGAACRAYHRRREHNLVVEANATPAASLRRAVMQQDYENARMALIEGQMERELIREAEHARQIAYLRAKVSP